VRSQGHGFFTFSGEQDKNKKAIKRYLHHRYSMLEYLCLHQLRRPTRSAVHKPTDRQTADKQVPTTTITPNAHARLELIKLM